MGTATADGGRFRVLRPHARGGLGAVFVALDSELNREVALKQILDHHADDPVSRSRFLVEAEITGGLEHPGIVPVYGLGTHDGGRPYYAMRFIRGDSLKEASDRFHAGPKDAAGLELRRLLRRFLDVCNAVDYAHSRGILHRDLKPSNVILGKHGETLVVDWGLAKPIGRVDPADDSGERTLMPSSASGSAETLPGSALGTPAYMSPEQAAGDLEQLGPCSDVYSLGATLYCLLTGKAPFAGDAFDVLRQVQRGEFRRPRQCDPAIDPALEAVCLKAMALGPEDRYPSARALADDVERWTADEPVSAYREPLARRARRWARRHRMAVTAASVSLVAGVVGLSALAVQQARANSALTKANGRTLDALGQARKARDEAAAALAWSEESRKQAEAVGNFLVDSFRKPDPRVAGKDVKVADVLDQARAGLKKGFAGSKATEGALLDALGQSYKGLGLPQKAEEAHRKARAVREEALGPAHRETIRSAHQHSVALWEAGRPAEALALLEEVIRRQRDALGHDDADALDSRDALGCWYAESGRHAEAVRLQEATLAVRESKLGPDHLNTLASRANLAVTHYYAGRYAEAVRLNAANLKAYEAKLGPNHPDTFTSRHNLADALRASGQYAEAVRLHEANLKAAESELGPNHTGTLNSRHSLAVVYQDCGRYAEAVRMHEATLAARASKLGPDHPRTLASRDALATAYASTGRYAEAVRMHEATLAARASKLGPDNPYTISSRKGLAVAYEALGRWAVAEALERETLARRRKREKPDSPLLAGDLANLGRNLLKQARPAEAEPLLRECLAVREKAIPDSYPRFLAMSLLGGALLGQGKCAEAEPLVVAGYEGMKAREAKVAAPYKFHLSEAAERVVGLYEAWDKPEQARAWAEKLGLAELPADVFARP